MDTCNARYYLDKLPERLQALQIYLRGSFFTMYDTAAVYQDMVVNHAKYGKQKYMTRKKIIRIIENAQYMNISYI